MEVEKIRQKTVVQQVMERIRELIASGRYRVGDRIPTEQELAGMFGIGRSSIREAIKVFNYMGILESHTAKGTFVSDRTTISSEALIWSILLARKELYELIELRASIELSCLMALTVQGSEDREKLARVTARLNEQIAVMESTPDGSGDRVVQADYDFHSIIIESSGNSIFVSVWEILKAFMLEEIRKAHDDIGSHSFLAANHGELVAAIGSGDRMLVIETFRKHIENTVNHLKRQIGTGKEAQGT